MFDVINIPLDPKPFRLKHQCYWRVPTGHPFANLSQSDFDPRPGYSQDEMDYR